MHRLLIIHKSIRQSLDVAPHCWFSSQTVRFRFRAAKPACVPRVFFHGVTGRKSVLTDCRLAAGVGIQHFHSACALLQWRGRERMETKKGNVLLYVPNIIGYFRLLLIALAFPGYSHPMWFVPLYTVSILLDVVDGYAARKLNQCSEFGAWLDVVVDLVSRGLLWCSLGQYGYLVVCVEWLTFVSTHCRGAQWKIPEDSFPWVVTRVMANGFKTSWGAAAIGGLHLLPLWLYAYQWGFLSLLHLPLWSQLMGLALLTGGRVLCLFVEIFYIYSHVVKLLHSKSSRDES